MKADASFGIVGYGPFGELVAHLLAPYGKVVVHSRRDIPAYDLPKNVCIGSMHDIADCDVVILCNELAVLKNNCKQLAPLVKPMTIVMDVCSVKLLPAQILSEVLGDRCRVLATHPLFGPQTIPQGNGHGKKIVWHEISGGPFDELEAFVTDKLGLHIVRISPEEHDKQMAWVHGLTFFIGRGLMELNPPHSELTTNYYERLMSAVNIEKHHSYELFKSIQLGNIYSGQVRKDFLRIMQTIDEQLREDHI